MPDSSRIGKPFGPGPRDPAGADGVPDLSKTGGHPVIGPSDAESTAIGKAGGVSQPLWDRVLGSDVHKLLRSRELEASGMGLPDPFVTKLRDAFASALSAPVSVMRSARAAGAAGGAQATGPTGETAGAMRADGAPETHKGATPAQQHIAWSLQRETLWTTMGTSFSIQGGRLVITMFTYGAGGVVVGYVVDEVIDLARRGKVDAAVHSWAKLGGEFFRHEDVPRIVGHVLRRTVVEGHRAFGAFVSRLETWLDSLLPDAPDGSDRPLATPEQLQPWLDEFESLMRQHPEDFLHMAHLAQRFLEVAARRRD